MKVLGIALISAGTFMRTLPPIVTIVLLGLGLWLAMKADIQAVRAKDE
jgi:hypothetical protein